MPKSILALVDVQSRPVHWYMDINIQADNLWMIFSDFRGVAVWWPDKDTRFDFIGNGIGMIRNIYPIEGPMLSQRLEAMNHASMTVEMSLLNCRDFGMKSFRGSMSIKAIVDGWCRLTYMAIAECLDASTHDLHANAIEAYLDGFYTALKTQLESSGIGIGASGQTTQ